MNMPKEDISKRDLVSTAPEAGLPVHVTGRDLINRQTDRNEKVFQAFRDIRSQIVRRGGTKLTMVSSVVDSAGATFVSVNLATTFAMQVGSQAIVVDCNFGEPGVGEFLGVENEVGLSDYLLEAEKPAIRDIVQATPVRGMLAVTTGTVDDLTEHITSPRLPGFFVDLQDAYPSAHIIVDAPCTKMAADVRILSSYCGQVILVVPYGRATASRVEEAKKTIDGEKLAGGVFNQQPG